MKRGLPTRAQHTLKTAAGSATLSVEAARRRALRVLSESPALVFGQGTKTAEEEAEWLSEALATGSGSGAVEAAALDEALERRVTDRRPMAFVTGWATLCGLRFRADSRALVPRSYIAELIENWPEDVPAPASCLDLCCGNGNLAIAAALRLPSLRSVVAADVSCEALELARENVDLHRVGHRVWLLRSDMWERVTGRFDLILCNPPYVRDSAMKKLPQEYRHEPALGLSGGPDGLRFVRAVLGRSDEFLTPGGHLILEVGWGQKAALKREFPHIEFDFAETSAGEGPVCIVQKKS